MTAKYSFKPLPRRVHLRRIIEPKDRGGIIIPESAKVAPGKQSIDQWGPEVWEVISVFDAPEGAPEARVQAGDLVICSGGRTACRLWACDDEDIEFDTNLVVQDGQIDGILHRNPAFPMPERIKAKSDIEKALLM